MTSSIQRQLAESRARRRRLVDAEVRRTSETWAETLVRFLTSPIMASLLMTIGILGILSKSVAGIGLPGLVGLLSFALFFWGSWLVQLAGWEELVLVGAGCSLSARRCS